MALRCTDPNSESHRRVICSKRSKGFHFFCLPDVRHTFLFMHDGQREEKGIRIDNRCVRSDVKGRHATKSSIFVAQALFHLRVRVTDLFSCPPSSCLSPREARIGCTPIMIDIALSNRRSGMAIKHMPLWTPQMIPVPQA